jgi:hypothetical protein
VGRDAMDGMRLPKFDYYLDESDPDILVLRRQDGSFVAAFSARGATRESIVEAAEEDYRSLLDEHAGWPTHQQDNEEAQDYRGNLGIPSQEGGEGPMKG